jgi:hypothetical protein
MTVPLELLDGYDRAPSGELRGLWPEAVAWVEPYYDSVHLRHTVKWLVRLDPQASEPLVVAALTHDIERHFPGGTQPDKQAGAWDDVAYNTRHASRSADIVDDWLASRGLPEEFRARVRPSILEHEFGGSAEGDVLQAADSLSFLEVNVHLVSAWVQNGETTLRHGLRKLEWMYDRIRLEHARTLALPYYERSRARVRADAERPVARS